MLRVALASVRVHAPRSVLAGIAVMLAVAFFAGTLIYADTARAAFAADFELPGRGVDVVVNPPVDFGYGYLGSMDEHTLDQADLARVRAIPGVAAADGRVVADLPLLGVDGRALANAGRVGLAVSVPHDPDMAPMRLVEGRFPAAAGEAALDRPTARRLGRGVGDSVTVLDPARAPHHLTIVGVVDFGASPLFAGWSIVALSDADLGELTGATRYTTIVAKALPGINPQTLVEPVRAAVGGGAFVETGEQLRHNLAVEAVKYVDEFGTVLRVASLVALVVAALVVFNTFTILVTQRRRELALLRCVGASRAQVFRVMLIESTVVGLVGSLLGALASLGVARSIVAGRDAVGAAEPVHALTVTPLAITAGLAVGLIVTIGSGLLPGLAASRVPPVTELRTVEAAQPEGPLALARLAAAIAIGATGLVTMWTGTGHGFGGMPAVVGGAMLILVAMVLALPLVAKRLIRFAGTAAARGLGVPGRLAIGNAARHPARVAATAGALMIGMALISLFSVILATAQDQAQRELAENFPVDYALTAAGTTTVAGRVSPSPLPPRLDERLRQQPEFATVVRTRSIEAETSVGWLTLSTIEPGQWAPGFEPEVLAGDIAAIRPGSIAIRAYAARARGLAVGDSLTIITDRESRTARIAATFDDAPVQGELLLEWSDFANQFRRSNEAILLRRASGVDEASARSTLDHVLRDYPLVTVDSGAERVASLTSALQRRINQLRSLLVMSALIAIVGIMDTLALAVIERTRESATLRALGLSRRQLDATLLVEALAVTVIGATLGVCFGVAVGWVTAQSLISGYGHGAPAIPVLQLVGYLGLAAAAGALASVLPARRARSSAVVSALADP